MKCNVCGRELQDGQMFCQCGNTVGYAGGEDLSLYPKKKSGAMPLLIGMAAGAVIFVLIIVFIATALTRDSRSVTDRASWERVSGEGYSITMPSGLKDTRLTTNTGGMTVLKEVSNSEVAIAIGSKSYNAADFGSINRKKLEEMLKRYMPAEDGNGHAVELKEHGSMFYYEYTEEASGMFFGASTVHVVDAMCVGKSAIYDVIIVCPEKKYAVYEPYIFSWVDSFHGE